MYLRTLLLIGAVCVMAGCFSTPDAANEAGSLPELVEQLMGSTWSSLIDVLIQNQESIQPIRALDEP